MRLSILDQSSIAEGATGGQALLNSIELAKLGDKLGYHRFWMAEHHATPALASASPELMLAAIGRETEHIRLGTGGVMLPHYSPFKVAESFSMLAGLLPGRIDLGLGRAPGSDQLAAYALQQDRRQRAPNIFPEQLGELLGYLDGDLPSDHPFRHLAQTLPGGAEHPAIWVLGSSPDSARLAGAMGLPYCIADFIAGEVPELAHLYRESFRPSPRAAQPELIVCCWLVAADSDERAHWLAAPSRMLFAHLTQGRLIAVPHPDKATEWLAANPSPMPGNRCPIVGTAAECRAALQRKQALYGADEMMLVNILHDHRDRMESYRLMAPSA
ncbi:LLM class flavin-dependent oxidoreductase [Sandaracinobacter sp. RS1-74]|uniref:LLM class flavin-dependent oxidoreductase n=1 Tax=Sandaracinobacteroides sayramensis TaxID=2913411 RepID=UPI001EDB7637|nr:LLM class flavin-dependent oxidoreductase [Sandaracinobacteroides sayramensis]MCG2841520.1 LLM class flavin-dependent oxidoreductase [Sandaracinobacteroides sayramensis]